MEEKTHSGWDLVIGQDRPIAALRRTIESGRIAHAYLFHGPEGVGKLAAAVAMSQALQCTRRDGSMPCNECTDCRKVARLIHPDIHVVLPHPKISKDDPLPDDYGTRIEMLGRNPYDIVDYRQRPDLDRESATSNKQVEHRRTAISDRLRKEMSFARAEGGWRIAILTDVDLMRTESGNAFLKVLEEPGRNTVFFLLTSRLDSLLPTIVSRCQRIRFDLLDPTAIERALIEREGMDAEAARMLARMADGSYSRARNLADSRELLGSRDLVLDFLRHSWAGKGDVLVPFIQKMERMGREPLKFLMQVLLTLLRDLMLVRHGGSDAPIVNVDRTDVLVRFSNSLPDARLDDMVATVEQAIYLMQRNVHVRLILMAMSRSFGRAMHGERTGGLDMDLAAAAVEDLV